MTTPTNHTHSSLFDFGDTIESAPSQSSLEQNSSIEESQIFVSMGGEVSGHTRYSSSALSGASGLKSKGFSNNTTSHNTNISDSLLGPLEEEPETPVAREETTTPTGENTAEATTPTITPTQPQIANSILRPSSYAIKPPEQQEEKQHEEEEEEQGPQKPNLIISTDSGTTNEDHDTISHHALSPTLHTSNQTPGGALKQNKNDFDFENAGLNLRVNDQNAEHASAWAIHLALIFFCALVVACSVLTFTVIHTYGFFTLFLLAIVVAFCGFLACFVDSTILSQNPKLKPVRQKILTAVQATRKIIEEEYESFVRDWREEVLMLTEGGENYDPNVTGGTANGTRYHNSDFDGTTLPQQRRKKSKVFKLVRPFLGLKKKLSKAKGRRKKEKSVIPFDEMPSYNPPAVGIV